MQLRAVGQVSFEGVLDADGDALRLAFETTRVDSAGPVVQDTPDAAGEHAPELDVPEGGQRADRRNPRGDQALLRLRADSREPAHVERRQEACLLTRWDHGQPAGLAMVTGDLGHHLRGGDAECAGEARRGPDGRLNGLSDLAGLEKRLCDLADVEETLIKPRFLDGGNDSAHRLPHVLRILAVEGMAGVQEDGLRASPGGWGPRAPRPRRRRHRGRDGRRSWSGA